MEYSSIACCEEHTQISETFSRKGEQSATATLRVAWNLRHNLIYDLLQTPRLYPHNPLMWAVNCSATPWDSAPIQDGQGNQYTDALVVVNYSNVLDDNNNQGSSGQLYSESIEPNVENMTLDHTRFRWSSASGDVLRENEAPTRPLYSIALTRTLYKIPTALPGDVLSLIGKCNSDSYFSTALGLNFGAETLLCLPTSSSKSVTSQGDPGYDVVFKFAYKPETWNKFWRAGSQSYEGIFLSDGNEYKNFPSTSFGSLLY